ncbi:hypothetical protein DFH28DRAFT_496974 [Melampsora americana]|nr:hypothetical protein DFH28DRAFT_496974 [Melampsora americana]
MFVTSLICFVASTPGAIQARTCRVHNISNSYKSAAVYSPSNDLISHFNKFTRTSFERFDFSLLNRPLADHISLLLLSLLPQTPSCFVQPS